MSYRTRLGWWALSVACLCLLQTWQTLTALAVDKRPLPRIVPDITKLRSPSADVRAGEAERVAGARAEDLSPVLPELLTALADPDARVRRHIGAALGKVDDRRAVRALLGALDDEDPDVRTAVVISLGRPGVTDAVEPLMKVLRTDESHSVQARAATELGDIGSPEAVPLLVEVLGSPRRGVWVRECAARALGSFRDEPVFEPLVAALKDDQADVRQGAVDGLGRLRDPRAAGVLIAALKDKDSDVRESAALAMRFVRNEKTLQALIGALQNDKSAESRAAAAALSQYGPDAVGALIAGLKSEDIGLIQNAASSLGTIGDKRAVGPLTEALKDPRYQVRNAAAKALYRLGAPSPYHPTGGDADRSDRMPQEVREQIKLLSSGDAKTRAAAAARLGRLGEAAAPAVPGLVRRLKDHPPAKHEGSIPIFSPAHEALEALVRIGKPAVPKLIAALADEDPVICTRVVAILGRIGDPRAKPHLRDMLSAENPQVRAHAAMTLGKIGGPDTLEPLLAAAKDPHPLVQRLALAGLALSPGIAEDPRVLEPLLALFQDPHGPKKDDVARVLGTLKDRRAVEPLIAALTGSMAHRPWRIAAALGEIGDRRAVEPLIKLLDHPHEFARSAAVRALIQMEAGHRAYVAITSQFACEAPYDYSRETAINELAKVGEPAVPALTDALADENAAVRESAVATLRKIYGAGFDEGGKQWLIWKRQLLKELADPDCAEPAAGRSVADPRRRKLVEAARFAVPGQIRVFRFLAFPEKVIASVQYRAGEASSLQRDHLGRGTRPLIKSALVAWTPSGKLLWRTDLRPAYRLLTAGNQLVLAFDWGGLKAERELVWVDLADGHELHRTSLPGRPGQVVFNPHSESLVIVLYPQRRLRVIDEETWMEVRSYKMDGALAWRHTEPVSELTGIRLDGAAVVVGSTVGKERFVAGLDPLTGKSLWRRKWGRFPSVPELGTPRPKSLEGLACVAKTEGLEFLDPATGATLHALPRPKVQRLTPKFCKHTDRIYYTSMQLEGFTLAAQAFPAGNVLWSDCTGTVSYGVPAAWGQDTVFLCRRLSGGLTGRVTVTELRVYSPAGELLSKITKQRVDADGQETGEGYFDDTVAAATVGQRLYVVDLDEVVALRWEQDAR